MAPLGLVENLEIGMQRDCFFWIPLFRGMTAKQGNDKHEICNYQFNLVKYTLVLFGYF